MKAHLNKKCFGLFTLAFIVFFAFLIPLTTPLICFSQSIDLTIGDYALVSKQRVGRTAYDYIFTANITNNGTEDATNVTATLTSLVPTTTVIDGSLTFGAVPAGATVTSSDTFTVRIDRFYPFNESDLSWDIHYEVGEAGLRLEVGPEGGTLRFDRFEVIVPPGPLPEPVEISVTKAPSQADEMAQDLDPARFRAIGPAFQLKAPFLLNEPLTLTLSYDENDIPAGFEAQNLAIISRLVVYRETFGEDVQLPIGSRFPPLPSQVDEQARTVQAHIFTGGTFQVVALAEPLMEASLDNGPQNLLKQGFAWLMILLNSFNGKEAIAQSSADPTFKFIDSPSGVSSIQFKDAVTAGLKAAYQKLVLNKGFSSPPLGNITVYSKAMAAKGEVGTGDPTKIYIDSALSNAQEIASVAVHEFFHVIQFSNSNPASLQAGVRDYNFWFLEGTAEWATDLVYDNVPGNYLAPEGYRFVFTLNAKTEKPEADSYETVAFWKWLEKKKAPGAIQKVIAHHRALTHKLPLLIEHNSQSAYYLDSLIFLYDEDTDLNFLQFLTEVLYKKGFDKNEVLPMELWDLNFLGPPKTIPLDLRLRDTTIFQLKKGGDGDGKANAKTIDYTLEKYLASAPRIITNGEGAEALSGTLHLEFEGSTDPHISKFQVVAISLDNDKEKAVLDMSTTKELTFGFGKDSEVLVIPTDPRWKAPTGLLSPKWKFKAWVEPCGGEPPSTVVTRYVYTEDELYSAIEKACCGETILLAPGRYWLPGRTDYPNYSSLYIEKGVTIAGSGTLETTLVLSGDYSGIFIGTWPGVIEQATFRDLRIEDRSYWGPFFVWGNVRRFSLCNVIVESGQQDYGLHYQPYGIAEKLELHGTDFVCQNCQPNCYEAIVVEPIDWPVRPDVEVQMRDSSIWNWDIGIRFLSTEGFGDVTLDIDCTKISGNQWNVLEGYDCDPQCKEREHCPSGP